MPKLNSDSVFVFGSNLSGVHGAGAALFAHRDLGYPYRVGEGLRANKHGLPSAYALPTKDYSINTLPLEDIKEAVERFISVAKDNPDLHFFVTRVGCGLAGLNDYEMAPMFEGCPENCIFDESWKPYLGETYSYFKGNLTI